MPPAAKPTEESLLLAPSAASPRDDCCSASSYGYCKKAMSFITLTLLFILPPAASDFYLPALPSVAESLNCTDDMARLTIQLNIVVSGFAAPVSGAIADRTGKRWASVILMMVFCVATIGSAFSPNVELLLFFRLVQGVAESVPVVVLSSVRTYSDDPQERLKFFLFIQMAFPFVLMLAPSAGGLTSAAIGWRGAFASLAVIGFILLGMIMLFFPEDVAGQAEEMDKKAQELAKAGEAKADEEKAGEEKAEEGLNEKAGRMLGDVAAIFYQPSQLLLLLASAWPFCIMTLILQSFSFALENHLLYSISDTSLYLALLPLGLLISPIVVPRLLDCGGKVIHVLAFGALLTLASAVSLTVLAACVDDSAPDVGRFYIMPTMTVAFMMYTTAMGTLSPPLQAAYLDLAPAKVSGVAAGMVFFAQQVLPQVLSMAMADWSINALTGYLFSVATLQYVFMGIFWPLFAWFVCTGVKLSEKPPPPPV